MWHLDAVRIVTIAAGSRSRRAVAVSAWSGSSGRRACRVVGVAAGRRLCLALRPAGVGGRTRRVRIRSCSLARLTGRAIRVRVLFVSATWLSGGPVVDRIIARGLRN